MATYTGSGSVALGTIKVAATGKVVVSGTVNATWSGISVTATGGVPVTTGFVNIGGGGMALVAHGTVIDIGHASFALAGLKVTATGIRTVRGSGHVSFGAWTMAAVHTPRSITLAPSKSFTSAHGALTRRIVIPSATSTSVTSAAASLAKNLLRPPSTDTGHGVESRTVLDIRAALLDHFLDSYVVPDVKHWELENERFRHDQALYRYGEYAIFVTMWTLQDFTAGLVGRCGTCYAPQGALEGTWQQPAYTKCPDCLGTSFAGGYKAILVRPSLWTWDEQTQQQVQRGVINTNVAQVQTTSDFRLQPRDYIIRGDGSRWQAQEVQGDHLDTGFGTQAGIWNATAFIYNNVTREDESSVIYLLPINQDYIQAAIPQWYSRQPVGDF